MEFCEVKTIHFEKVQKAAKKIPDPVLINNLADIFKTLGDPGRIKILMALGACELCVCDLAAVSGLSESAMSHQLRTLRMQKIVKYRREGKILFYSRDNDLIASLVEKGIEHMKLKNP